MESPLGLVTVHWDQEPLTISRQRESADKSDALQTLRARPSQWITRQRLECVRLQRRFPKACCDSMAGQVHGELSEFWIASIAHMADIVPQLDHRLGQAVFVSEYT